MKIAIVGSAPSMKYAPFNSDWQIWGMAFHATVLPSHDLLFEMHDPAKLPMSYRKTIKALESVVMRPELAKRYNAQPYPFEACAALGRPYFTSSAAYMIAAAILANPEEIALYGINMADDTEYVDQRPCCEYWLGIAEGRGIKVTVHESSPVLKGALYGTKDFKHSRRSRTQSDRWFDRMIEVTNSKITAILTDEMRGFYNGMATGFAASKEAMKIADNGGSLEEVEEMMQHREILKV